MEKLSIETKPETELVHCKSPNSTKFIDIDLDAIIEIVSRCDIVTKILFCTTSSSMRLVFKNDVMQFFIDVLYTNSVFETNDILFMAYTYVLGWDDDKYKYHDVNSNTKYLSPIEVFKNNFYYNYYGVDVFGHSPYRSYVDNSGIYNIYSTYDDEYYACYLYLCVNSIDFQLNTLSGPNVGIRVNPNIGMMFSDDAIKYGYYSKNGKLHKRINEVISLIKDGKISTTKIHISDELGIKDVVAVHSYQELLIPECRYQLVINHKISNSYNSVKLSLSEEFRSCSTTMKIIYFEDNELCCEYINLRYSKTTTYVIGDE